MKLKKGTTVRGSQCVSCPFREGGLDLGHKRMTEIETYLINGTNHMCHSDESNKTICRGGRNYQLEMWTRLGIISEPTDAALESAIKERR